MKETAPPKTTLSRRPTASRTTSLIEFPGVNRSALPEWRKELGERVREVQERRAREATIEAAEIGPLFTEAKPKSAPMLELMPRAETPPMNPLVVAALRRIERAHSRPGGHAAAATALAYEEQPTVDLDPARANPAIDQAVSKPERSHNLAAVPTPEMTTPNSPHETRKPRRVIDDHNDPALNYLDSIPTSGRLERREHCPAPVVPRVFSAIADLAVVGLFSLPFLALTELTNIEWQNPRAIGFAVGTFLIVGFLYLTVSVAFTGRTIGMKLFSLRVVDARTGLIPTGSQAAGRSLVYLLSLASAGVALIYTFISSEKHTVHDRLTRTAVIRA
ncbi:MAG: RDD family protein [Pyrinomonadaceae bacterium]